MTGLNDTGIKVGYFYNTNNGTAFDDQFGFYLSGGVFHEVNNPNTPKPADVEPGVSPRSKTADGLSHPLIFRGPKCNWRLAF